MSCCGPKTNFCQSSSPAPNYVVSPASGQTCCPACNASMFGVNCQCNRPPTPPVRAPEPKYCPYLVCPCPEKCVIEDHSGCIPEPEKCGRVDCRAQITGFDLSCNPCRKNCPVETYCPVPKSCLPRCNPNSPHRFPHYNWKQLNTKNFHAI